MRLPTTALTKFGAAGADISKVNQTQIQQYLNENTYDGSSGDTATATADRRRSTRQEQHVPAWLSEPSDAARRTSSQQQVLVTDLSLHGVGFQSDRMLEIGATHWIVIATDRLHLSTRLEIVSARAREDGGCDVGAEFF